MHTSEDTTTTTTSTTTITTACEDAAAPSPASSVASETSTVPSPAAALVVAVAQQECEQRQQAEEEEEDHHHQQQEGVVGGTPATPAAPAPSPAAAPSPSPPSPRNPVSLAVDIGACNNNEEKRNTSATAVSPPQSLSPSAAQQRHLAAVAAAASVSPVSSPLSRLPGGGGGGNSSSARDVEGAIPFSAVRLKREVLGPPRRVGSFGNLARLEEVDKSEMEEWVEKIGQIVEQTKAQGKPSKLLTYLIVGALSDATDVMKLRLLGVTHTINCCSQQAATGDSFYGGKIKCLEVPAMDEADYDILQHFEQVKEFIDAARASGGKVLMHCFAGQNRSCALAVAYAALRTRQPMLKLIETVAKDRRLVLNNLSFRRQLVKWAQKNDLRLV